MKDLKIIYNANVDYGETELKFGFNNSSQIVTSSASLLQKVLLTLFTKMGTNAFNVNFGSSLFTLIGGNYDAKKEPEVRTLIRLAFDEIEKELLNEQINQENLTPDETLISIEVTDVKHNMLTHGWDVSGRINTASKRNISFRI